RRAGPSDAEEFVLELFDPPKPSTFFLSPHSLPNFDPGAGDTSNKTLTKIPRCSELYSLQSPWDGDFLVLHTTTRLETPQSQEPRAGGFSARPAEVGDVPCWILQVSGLNCFLC
ncbi:hypothetical protein Nmel_015360, partial [Mimus melanotis]